MEDTDMTLRIASLTILCLALAAIPAFAQYDNGPINGTTDAWTINFGYIVSDTFTLSNSGSMTGFQIGIWKFPGDTFSSVEWSVTTAENGGSTLGSGTASGSNVSDTFISTNQFGYDIDRVTVTASVTGLTIGTTYWLNLQYANGDDPVYWDENSGVGCKSNGCPSMASESSVGTIPSEAFTINTGSSTTPEPSDFVLFGSGVLGVASFLRRKPLQS
jgi:hypothetical protein